jgi:hypothetical protein
MARDGGIINLPKLDGFEVKPGVFLIGEPTLDAATGKYRCLANVAGCLAVVELRVTLRVGSS